MNRPKNLEEHTVQHYLKKRNREITIKDILVTMERVRERIKSGLNVKDNKDTISQWKYILYRMGYDNRERVIFT